MKYGLVLLIAVFAMGCKSSEVARYEKAKDKIAKRAEKICPDVATGISTAGMLPQLFASDDDAEDIAFITDDVTDGAMALCGVLIGMKENESAE